MDSNHEPTEYEKNNVNRQLFNSPTYVSPSLQINCVGISTYPEDSKLLTKCQDNLRTFLKTSHPSSIYCPLLCSIKNGEDTLIRLSGFMGFILPRNESTQNLSIESMKTLPASKLEAKLIHPIGFYHVSNDGMNNFLIQSYECTNKMNKVMYEKDTCGDCKLMWRSIRNNSHGKTITLMDHNKRMKSNEKEHAVIIEKKNEIMKQDRIKLSEQNKKINRLLKRISYWKIKFKTLNEAVTEWRKIEQNNNGFLSIEDDEASKWEEFYKFIDGQIDKEQFDDEEMRNLHKELIRSETCSLGKFNKRNDKRGIIKTKISSRILNYSLTLATALGKTSYEEEAKLRSLPSWSTLTRYLRFDISFSILHQVLQS